MTCGEGQIEAGADVAGPSTEVAGDEAIPISALPEIDTFDTQVGFNRLAHSAKQSGSFVRDGKLAFMSPSEDDYDQETDPRTNHGCRETANV